MSENKNDLKAGAGAVPFLPARRRLLLGLATTVAVVEAGALAATPRTGLAATFATSASAVPGSAQAVVPAAILDRFMALSRVMTARADLSAETGARIYQALLAADASRAAAFEALFALPLAERTAEQVLAAARGKGRDGLLHELVAAWYTGTVGQGNQGVLVAYAEALMYRTVSDGLIVPTYGSYGPLWWTGNPPALGIAEHGRQGGMQA
ncbi:sugar dehydrogenase complex small subunit [Frateuria aurantia]|uniref:Membrane bound FAD containing D-sorbitol dehydrogenase n=1 Tax=Frateuria aurantia (strain ATCC 33424 / DSM 6220 / KCTC 2777 / LMG 1558 / NBRC 3245 / NCIMB 13370) TaxID=767434 RepID=H8KZC9_FRAAD|nr:sugar dehydrogenase complex small subunit [Frateuria aurantia]AFC85235.1 Membrane bound FAD containing D-sorbitol dehydrogenase [Frateuria aurantia DSM 6220]